jgi:hypothetical protein
MNVVLYAREGWGPNLQMIRPGVIQHAEFHDGGRMMRSRNVTYVDLSLRRSDLPAVIELLTKLNKKNAT